jgi:hypothetical protein
MKSLIITFFTGLVFTLNAQKRDLIYANSVNSISLYTYNNDSKLKYTLFYKLVGSEDDILGFEYVNFKKLKDLKAFVKDLSKAMKMYKPIYAHLENQSIQVYGVTERITVFDVDGKRGIIHKDDISILRSKINGL